MAFCKGSRLRLVEKKSVLYRFVFSSRVSAHKIEFAQQIHKKREHVSRFLYTEREKVSEWELSDDFGTAHGPFLLVGETVVSRQPDSGTENCSVPLYALYIV